MLGAQTDGPPILGGPSVFFGAIENGKKSASDLSLPGVAAAAGGNHINIAIRYLTS